MSSHWRGIHLFIVAMSAAMIAAPIASAAGEGAGSAIVADPAVDVMIGVGLVVGLPGTGDTDIDDTFVDSSIVGVLRHAGLDVWRGQIKPGRIAKVMVTAELPADASDGKRVAVRVTAIGDATSLAGGTLLATSLRDEDGENYAVGQGHVDVGNQVANAELSEQPGRATRVGVLAEGAILDSARAR